MDFQSKKLLVIDFEEEIPTELPEVDILLLRNNTKVHLDKILERWQPSIVIAGGSNGPWDFERWRKSCSEANITFNILVMERFKLAFEARDKVFTIVFKVIRI